MKLWHVAKSREYISLYHSSMKENPDNVFGCIKLENGSIYW
jgi:hypothetical protein